MSFSAREFTNEVGKIISRASNRGKHPLNPEDPGIHEKLVFAAIEHVEWRLSPIDPDGRFYTEQLYRQIALTFADAAIEIIKINHALRIDMKKERDRKHEPRPR